MKDQLITRQQIIWETFAWLGFMMVMILSFVTWLLSYDLRLTTAYNDSMSHLNLSRFVFDNIEPGFAQMGGVWLPVSHMLALPLIWNDWAWHSGFAGSLPSMISYVVSVVATFSIVRTITRSRVAAFVGAAALALNLNLLFLQTTALTEPLYLCFFVLSAWAYVKYVTANNPKYLILMGLFGFLQVLTRYDGWFVIGCEAILVGAYEWGVKRRGVVEGFSKVLMFALPAGFGVLLWLLWNYLIFNDLFFFALGPFSAHSQQTDIQQKAGLITKHNLPIAFMAYWYTITNNVGAYITGLGILGSVTYLITKLKEKISVKVLIILFMLTPIIFNVLALFLGFSVINIPELNWNRSNDPSGSWFNVRYGILALPFFAVFVGILARSIKPAGMLLLILIVWQGVVTFDKGLITVVDGTKGSSSFDNYDTGDKLKEFVKPGDNVLLSTSFFNSVAFVSGLPLKTFIHEGVSREWSEALAKPQDYAKWVVLANGDTGESVYNSTVKRDFDGFVRNYKLAYSGNHAYIFKRKSPDEVSVNRQGDKLYLLGKEFNIKGVNAYDLAYLNQDQIKSTFKTLSEAKVNTVRFWVFGDGLAEGFQPQAGIFNKDRFYNVDLILTEARKYDIKVIPVLVNNWEEYGGKGQYLKWLGKETQDTDQFYYDGTVKNLFKNYVNAVVSRKNSISQISYNEDSSILAWDLMNEPRYENNPQVVKPWVEEISTFIREKDHEHLIMVGTERVASDTNEKHAVEICDSNSVDICSAHLYLYDKEKELFKNENEVRSLLSHQKFTSNSYNKPLVLGEWGIPKDKKPFDNAPLQVLKTGIEMAQQTGFNGFLLWNWSEKNDESFGFSPEGNKGTYNSHDLDSVINLK